MRLATVNHGEEVFSSRPEGCLPSTLKSQSSSPTTVSSISDIRRTQITPSLLRIRSSHRHQRTIVDILAHRSALDGNCFVVHRKLLRRRHVRKEQMRRQREAAKQQRDTVKAMRMDHNATYDLTINNADSFSDLDVPVSMPSPCLNTAGDHNEQFILGINRTNNLNTFHNFISTALPFSPLRSKRRKLVINS